MENNAAKVGLGAAGAASVQNWESAGGLLAAITLVVDHGDDLAWSEEDLERRRSGIGAVRMVREKLGWIAKNCADCEKG